MLPPRVSPKPWGKFVLTAAVIATATALARTFFKFGLNPGLLAVATVDQRLFLLRFSSLAVPKNQLVVARKTELIGFGSPAFTANKVWLSPDESLVAVRQVEYVVDNIDVRVTLFATSNAAALFSRTDISAPPDAITADHPAAPPLLKAIQAADDEIWEEQKKTDPAAVRFVTTAQFDDNSVLASLDDVAWTGDGKMLLFGSCPMITSTGIELDPVKWWGLVGFSEAAKNWDYLGQGIGVPPPAIALLPLATRKRAVALGPKLPDSDGFSLTIDGVTQTLKLLSAGVAAFDGPFKA